MKTFNPITPSLRNLIQLNKSNLSKKPLLKNQTKEYKRATGKNFSGKIMVSARGGGHKKKYRNIQFNRVLDETCIITSIEYDPFRSANIASTYNIKKKSLFIL